MAEKEEPLPVVGVPPGYKLLAWEGVGFFVPQRWDIGRHEGDLRRGSFRVDDEQRVVVQVRWWSSTRPVSIDQVVSQHVRQVLGDRGGDDAVDRDRIADLDLPGGDDDRVEAFALRVSDESDPSEWLVVWQNFGSGRVAAFRFIREGGEPGRQRLEKMLSGLRLQSGDEWRDWSVLDFSLRSPPGFALNKDALSSGVCYLRFRKGREAIALRRFSAADAILCAHSRSRSGGHVSGLDRSALEAWCRLTYAAEFHDMRYDVEEATDPAGRPMLRLRGNPRLLAPIELKWLIPEHRRLPRRIDIIWDRPANKIYSVEIRRPSRELESVVEEFERSLRMTLDWESLIDDPPLPRKDPASLPESRRQRLRSLRSMVSVDPEITSEVNAEGCMVVTYQYQRPAGLRFLRTAGGMAGGEETKDRTVELDLIGSLIWQQCDGRVRVCDLVESVRKRFQISYREAELSVTQFVKDLGSRGLLRLVMPEDDR